VIIFGTTGKTAVVRSTGSKRCPSCNANQPHNLVCHYDCFHIYWIFCHTTKRTYRDECSVCHRGVDLNTADVEKTLTQPAIPILDRFGIIFFGAGLLLLVMLIMVSTKGCR
jgi:hypothetical protein